MRRFLCLFFPRWPMQRLRLVQPETRDKPAALFERTAHGPRLSVCSGEANRAGLRTGMSVTDVRALVADVILHEGDVHADRADLESLAFWATRFSPLVAIERDGGHIQYAQSIFLETSGCEDVFGGEQALLNQVLSSIKKRGYRARVAIAPTPGAAWALAHYGRSGTLADSDPSALRAALEPLPLAALRLDSEVLDDLRPLGLNRIGDVLRQPRATLPSRFGPVLLERIDQALGVVPEMIPLLRPAPEFREAATFEYPIRNWKMLFNVLEKKVVKLAASLQRAARGARQIECWLYHEISAPACAQVALHRSSAGPKHLWQLLRARLEDLFRTPQGKLKSKQPKRRMVQREQSATITLEAEESICAIALQVPSTDPLDAGQLALFEGRAEEQNGDLALLLDRLVTRLGPVAVRRARLADDPLPERAYVMQTLDQHADDSAASIEAPTLERPLCLLPEPLAIQTDLRHSLVARGKSHQLLNIEGPERIESGWWREGHAGRDYYIVETQAHARFWIFQRRTDQRWFLHGIFE